VVVVGILVDTEEVDPIVIEMDYGAVFAVDVD
jgi:hypothetical protein